MRLVLQRVKWAKVVVENQVLGEISEGWCVLVGFGPGDGASQIQWLVKKLLSIKAWNNESVLESGRGVLSVSQFTLYADLNKGTKPSWSGAAPPNEAVVLYAQFNEELRKALGARLQTGRFGADMQVSLLNDGPYTLMLEKEA